ncbi:PRTRC system protein B [Flavobacterium sp. UBA4197]|uniref:PRTRC system protein B n=1 Tax=Flavobacterium sp. UBA4197 TaxID=1946546 RepID=UPI00257D3E8A|nr:PRTRC system protein B [Flavobacterium sp. UBA4197]
MKDITEAFGTLYHPLSALVFYQSKGKDKHIYVEHFDMDKNGNPINAHPLTTKEAKILSKALNTEKEESSAFLNPKGILPTNVLHINASENGTVLWFTKKKQVKMFFTENLGIQDGIAEIPAMLWFANKQNLMVFALGKDRRPTEKTSLYHAPFFNIYEDGHVCMGTVDINIKNSASIEEFIQAWEKYFFNSYFSHLLDKHNPVNGNCVSLWKNQIETGSSFPKEALKKTNRTLKYLIK